MKYLIFSAFLIALTLSCKKNVPDNTKKSRLKSFSYQQGSYRDSVTVQYSGNKVSDIKIIIKEKDKITAINNYALFYENEKLVSCSHTFEILDYYPKGIQLKSDENDQLTMISSGNGSNDFVLYYDYINKTRVKALYKSSRNEPLQIYEFDSEDNLTLVTNSKNAPTIEYKYNKVMNPFNDINFPVKPLLTFLSGPFQISFRFPTASKNAPVSYSTIPFNTVYTFKQRLNSKGQLIEASAQPSLHIYRFYYE